MSAKPPRPGDAILNRYCPDLTPDERECAHERLRHFARVIIGIQKRHWHELHGDDSPESGNQGRIRANPEA